MPRLDVYPVSQPVANPRPIVQDSPQSVWKPTVIQKVRLRGYVDEENRMHPPTYMYVVAQAGGWNVDAVNNPQHYVPATNAMQPVNLPGLNYTNSAVVPKANPNVERGSVTALFDTRQIRLTGLTSQADAEQARSMAGEGEVAIYDSSLGWVIVPQATMQSMIETPTTLNQPNPREQNVNAQGRVGVPVQVPAAPQTQVRAPEGKKPEAQPTPARPDNKPAATSNLFEDL